MRITFFLSLILTTTSLFAAVDSRLANDHLAYYGEEFYQNFPANISKSMLFKILHSAHGSSPRDYDTIGTCKNNCYTQAVVGYSRARVILFGEIHLEVDGKGKFVEDVYCGKIFYFQNVNDITNMGNIVNIEHTWPQSKFSKLFDKEMQKSDMHHLYPSDAKANGRRANYHFGSVEQAEDQLNLRDCNGSRLGYRNGKPIFTPPPEHRGNVARALFYFAHSLPDEYQKRRRDGFTPVA
jgi:deoxyribonuclease I